MLGDAQIAGWASQAVDLAGRAIDSDDELDVPGGSAGCVVAMPAAQSSWVRSNATARAGS